MKKTLTKHISLNHNQHHVHVEFSTPHRVMSSAVLNGGLVEANHIVNLNVPKRLTCPTSPQQTISKYCEAANWNGVTVGMMTAASMDSFRMAKETAQGIDIVVLVTSGLSNPRRVGDRADHRIMAAQSEEIGTINIVVMTSAILTEAAMVEALLIVTEAKSAALQEAGVMSPVSNKMATGTGTDSVAVVSGHGPETVGYCGKHVLFGEMLGRMVCDTVAASIAWDLENRLPPSIAQVVE
jgi:adenosylcobinamide amidohydrolase